MKAFNTRAMELQNVQLNAKTGPVFLIRDSSDSELDNVSSGAIVRSSRAYAGTDTFLSVAPGELKSIVLQGNSLTGARKPSEESAKTYPMLPESATESSWTENK